MLLAHGRIGMLSTSYNAPDQPHNKKIIWPKMSTRAEVEKTWLRERGACDRVSFH